jgi:hypothetical protein
MELNEMKSKAEVFLKGITAHILDEVIKADMSMHSAQIEVWKHFGDYKPFGNMINPDIHLGFAEERYLCLNEVRFTFHIRQIPESVYYRILNYLRNTLGLTNIPVRPPVMFDFCSPTDHHAVEMNVVVKRFENGTVSADYGPADDKTGELMKGETVIEE